MHSHSKLKLCSHNHSHKSKEIKKKERRIRITPNINQKQSETAHYHLTSCVTKTIGFYLAAAKQRLILWHLSAMLIAFVLCYQPSTQFRN